jgi:head-tail adaptor
MQIGRLRYKIELFAKTEVKSKSGAVQRAYQRFVTIPADVIPKSGSKGVDENMIFNNQFLEINIRYRTDINETNIIRWEGRIYKINFIDPVKFRATQRINVERIKERNNVITDNSNITADSTLIFTDQTY